MKLDADKIISRSFWILRDDSVTSVIFNKPPLKAFRCAESLKDLSVRSSLPRNLSNQLTGTSPCNRTVCRTCPHVNSRYTITTPKGRVNITGHFFCITNNVMYCLTRIKCSCTVYIGATGRRLANRFAGMSSTGEMTGLFLLTSTRPFTRLRTRRLR